jgi:hypothetical protein
MRAITAVPNAGKRAEDAAGVAWPQKQKMTLALFFGMCLWTGYIRLKTQEIFFAVRVLTSSMESVKPHSFFDSF